jgi:hypothetical protein
MSKFPENSKKKKKKRNQKQKKIFFRCPTGTRSHFMEQTRYLKKNLLFSPKNSAYCFPSNTAPTSWLALFVLNIFLLFLFFIRIERVN